MLVLPQSDMSSNLRICAIYDRVSDVHWSHAMSCHVMSRTPARSKMKRERKGLPAETPDCYSPFWWPVVGRDTFSLLAPAPGRHLKNGLCHGLCHVLCDLLLFMVASRRYCKQRSWVTSFRMFALNQLVPCSMFQTRLGSSKVGCSFMWSFTVHVV